VSINAETQHVEQWRSGADIAAMLAP